MNKLLQVNKKILLLGGSGNLGSTIIKSKLFKNLYAPKKKNLNILDRKSIKKIINKNKFDLIINCAAMARIIECEKNQSKAINVNINPEALPTSTKTAAIKDATTT